MMLSALILTCYSYGLDYTQTVRGKIIDRDTKMPLIGAAVVIDRSDPIIGTVTDLNGEFRLENIPVGRVTVVLSYLGYHSKTIPNIIVTSAKEVVLDLEMEENLLELKEVVVNGKKKGEVLNEMALISARTFTVDETKRYAGSLSDPSRMVSAFAGVTSNPEGNNDIVVRGNSPKGIMWRLEGVEIPNPNHFAEEGMTGGPINALNSEMLGNSDFYTGAFSPEYGNVLSGAFDMKLRTGNNEKPEYTFGFGVLGTDLTAEGPIKKDYGGSYLANYRYSSLAILDEAGLVDFDGVPKYQDASFKVNLPGKKAGSYTLFGLGGKSNIAQQDENTDGKILEKGDFGAYMGVIGLNHFLQLTDHSYLKSSVSMSANGSTWNWNKLDDNDQWYEDGDGTWEKSTVRASTLYSHKLNQHHRLVTGLSYAQFYYDMYNTYFDDDDQVQKTDLNFNNDAGMVQSYINWKYRVNDELTFVGGFHYLNFLLNHSQALEPRLAMKWQFNKKQSINAGFGMHSQVENIITYFATVEDANGLPTNPNTNLDLSKARHYVIGYEYRISNNLNAKIELYYQDLYNIPVENIDTSYYSILNADEGYIDKALVNKGTGKNYGVEFTLERYFYNNCYFLFTGSLYQSKYKSLEGIERNTKYNGNYALNFLIGKEFELGKNGKSRVLGLNTKFFLNGGRRYIPLNIDASLQQKEEVYDYTQAYNHRLDHVFQMNFTASYRINRPRVSHEFLIDVQNLTNNQARIDEYYNDLDGIIDYDRQLSMIPNIMYRIHF